MEKEGGSGEWAPTLNADGPLCLRGVKLTESEGDVVLSRPFEASGSPGGFSGNLRSRKHVSENLCPSVSEVLNAEHCRDSAATGCFDNGGSTVHCGF